MTGWARLLERIKADGRALAVGIRRRHLPSVRGLLSARYSRLASRGGVKIAVPARRVGRSRVWAYSRSDIRLGPDSLLVSSSSYNALASGRPCSIRTIAPGSSIRIGSGFRCTSVTIVARQAIDIGDRVVAGADVLIIDSDFHPLDSAHRKAGTSGLSAPVTIGDDVFLGARSIVLKGVSIGDGAVVGAGAVVARDVPPRCVAVGNPARIVRYLEGRA